MHKIGRQGQLEVIYHPDWGGRGESSDTLHVVLMLLVGKSSKSPPVRGSWLLVISQEQEFPETRMGGGGIVKSFIPMELNPCVSKVPFPLLDRGRNCSCGFERARI